MDDNDTTLSQLKILVSNFCEERNWAQFHNPKDLAIGVATEAGELLELFRFKTELQVDKMMKDEKKREQIGDELSDVLYFVVRFAQLNGFDLSKEIIRKINKNRDKYPIESSTGSNKKYDEA
ncbi:MAG: nucleotide pyrophosphohydrolase [Thermoplasmataceae archaeon]